MGKKKKRRKRLKIKSVLIFLLFILVIIGFFFALSLIKVRTYYVYDNNYLKDDEILNILKLDKNSSFITINTPFERSLAKKSKLIKDVKIKRTLDFEIKIYIKEYNVMFYDSINKKTILENNEEVDYIDNNAPILINEISDKTIYEKLVKKMGKVNKNSLNMISEITYSPNGIDKERFLFSMNDGNYVYVTLTKISKINDYKSIIDSVENKKGILYLDYGNYFVPKE
ncbi:MAG: FtsQ-type POTRA domain-containing protein [Bacilli bacterium]|nr:FtsQ-type POTRA domain-containing protein [Bacilli bacterium]